MSRTFKHQDEFNYTKNKGKIPRNRLENLLHHFSKLNFFDPFVKILYRKRKDFMRGGEARIKPKKYK